MDYPMEQGKEHALTARKVAKWVYVSLMAGLLCWYVYMLLFKEEIDTIPVVVWLLRLATAGLAVWLGKLWRDRGFMLLLAYLVYMFLRIVIPETGALFAPEAAQNLFTGLWMCAACYGLAGILTERELKRFLSCVIAVWTLGVLVYCGVGIYVCWTDQLVPGPGTGSWQIYEGRLMPLYLATAAGGIIGIALMLAMIMVLCVRNVLGKAVYVLASLVFALTLALTDSRTGFLSIAVGAGTMAGIGALRQSRKRLVRKGWAWLIALAAAACGAVVAFLAVHSLTPLFNHFKLKGGMLVSRAFAEAAEQVKHALNTRDYFSGGGLYLSGRWELWQDALAYLREHPMTLFFGNSVVSPLTGLTNYYAHCHNMPIQLTMENGLVGCLPLWIFLGMTAVRSVRIVRDGNRPLWLALVPVVILSQWIAELAETYTWFRASQCFMGAILFVAMGIVWVAERRRGLIQS